MSDKSSKMSVQTGAQLVVRALEAQGVTHIFGVPGAKIDAVFNALMDSKIKTVVCRHEQNAAFIAGGIGRMTGKAGVAIATSGPGVSTLQPGWRQPTRKAILLWLSAARSRPTRRSRKFIRRWMRSRSCGL